MNYKEIDLMSYLNYLGEDLKIDDFDDRIKIQKLVMIGESAGINIGKYSFNLYHKGPYSPDLATTYYGAAEAKRNGDTSYNEYVLARGYRQIADKIKPLLSSPKGSNLEKAEWLQIVSTLIFAYNCNHSWGEAKIVTQMVKEELLKKCSINIDDIIKKIQDVKSFN